MRTTHVHISPGHYISLKIISYCHEIVLILSFPSHFLYLFLKIVSSYHVLVSNQVSLIYLLDSFRYPYFGDYYSIFVLFSAFTCTYILLLSPFIPIYLFSNFFSGISALPF